MEMQNYSIKKLTQKLQFKKSKANNLILTDFNKFAYNLKPAKTKLQINSHLYTNNSLKNQKNIITMNNYGLNNNNLVINNISNNKDVNNKTKNLNTCKNENKQISYDNNMNTNVVNKSTSTKGIKCNSVNNLIGININVSYLNKNNCMNKIRSSFYNYSTKNMQKKSIKKKSEINVNDSNKYNNDNSKENISFQVPTRKDKNFKKKNITINPIQSDIQNIMENLKCKNNKSPFEGKNTISSLEESNTNNISFNNKTNANQNMEKSLSCKYINNNYINFFPNQIYKNKNTQENKEIYKIMIKSMKNRIHLIKDGKNDGELFNTINDFFIQYYNTLEDQNQKDLIKYIFSQIGNVINDKDDQIKKLQDENKTLLKKLKIIQKNNEEILENNNSMNLKINNTENKSFEQKDPSRSFPKNYETSINLDKSEINHNKISSKNDEENDEDIKSNSPSSLVNSDELESIRFFDKIKMKKHSIANIPELSFQKLKIESNKNVEQKKNKQININKNNNLFKRQIKDIIQKNSGNFRNDYYDKNQKYNLSVKKSSTNKNSFIISSNKKNK